MSGGSWEREGCLWSAAFALMRRVGDTTCHEDGNCIIVAMEKCLWGSIFGGKTDLGGGFWRRSGTHEQTQRATTSLKPGVSDINVAKY